MTSTLSNLCEEVRTLKTNFEQLRTEVNAKLSECSHYIESAEKLCQQAKQMTNNLEEKFINVSKEEIEWEDVKVELTTMSITKKIKLDVGGDIYATSIKTLTREKDTFFTALFSKQWELQCDPIDKSIFIDRDGKLFAHILAYLRTDQVSDDTMKNESLRRSLIIEAEYFRLHDLVKFLTIFPNGTLLKHEQKMKLNEFYGNRDQQWQLIYKASRDGFDTNTFHSRCDNKGPTMTIVQSNNNYLFGGYTSVAWTSSADIGYKTDTTAFLFTLTNPHKIPPTKYHIDPTKAENAIWYGSGYGLWFGDYDLGLSNNRNYTEFPSSYIDTTGKRNKTFTGARNFIVSDIEVFQLA